MEYSEELMAEKKRLSEELDGLSLDVHNVLEKWEGTDAVKLRFALFMNSCLITLRCVMRDPIELQELARTIAEGHTEGALQRNGESSIPN